MTLLKQTLCRHLSRMATRLALMLLVCATPGLVASAFAAPAQPPSTPEQALTQSVAQWVAQQQGGRADQVQLLPLDPRMRVQPCARPLAMDYPFAGPETVRVRCADPAWQLYVRVQPAARNAPAAAASASPATADARRPVVVAAVSLARGMTVQPGDVREQVVNLPPGGGPYLEQVSQALHSELLRDVPAGTPVRAMDLRPLVLVKRGQLVQISIGNSRGFMISARVEALQDGRMGEPIKLKNLESGRIITGVVRGPAMVEGQ